MYKPQFSSNVKNTSSAVKTQIKDKHSSFKKSTILIYHTEMFTISIICIYNSPIEMLVEQTGNAALW